MKITNEQLRKLIKEELESVLEAEFSSGGPAMTAAELEQNREEEEQYQSQKVSKQEKAQAEAFFYRWFKDNYPDYKNPNDPYSMSIGKEVMDHFKTEHPEEHRLMGN